MSSLTPFSQFSSRTLHTFPLSCFYTRICFPILVTQSQTQAEGNRWSNSTASYLVTAFAVYPTTVSAPWFWLPVSPILPNDGLWAEERKALFKYTGNTMTAVFRPSWDSLTDRRLIYSLCWDRDLQSLHTPALNSARVWEKETIPWKCVCHAQLSLPCFPSLLTHIRTSLFLLLLFVCFPLDVILLTSLFVCLFTCLCHPPFFVHSMCVATCVTWLIGLGGFFFFFIENDCRESRPLIQMPDCAHTKISPSPYTKG